MSWAKKEIIPVVVLAVFSTIIFQKVNSYRNRTITERIPFSFYLSIKDYINNNKESLNNRTLIGANSATENDSLITILIIGESLRANHIQFNGYHRTTMPKMESRKVISLPYIYTPFTHTSACLLYMLTRADNSNKEPMFSESSFIDAFNRSSFHTAWIGNQNPISTIRYFINECDTVFINKPYFSDYSNAPKYDSDLIEPFKEIVLLNNPLQLVIIQLAGHHWWYNKNLPDNFIYYQPILKNKTVSPSNRERMINSYDNVTLFTDSVIDQIIAFVENKNALVIFLSDHGESFGEDGKWLHGNDIPSEKNPAGFIWLSDKYQIKHSDFVANLQNNKNLNIDTSFLFHTIIHGSSISTPYLVDSLSLFISKER